MAPLSTGYPLDDASSVQQVRIHKQKISTPLNFALHTVQAKGLWETPTAYRVQ